MRALWRSAAATAALSVPLVVLDRRMQRTGGPGIIGFELAGTPERARRILDAWGQEGRAAARASLLLDYPFLVAYTAFGLAALRTESEALHRAGAHGLARAGRPVAAAQVAAGACDAVENAALLGVLATGDGRLPGVARAFARAKFALLGAGWVYALLALVVPLTRR